MKDGLPLSESEKYAYHDFHIILFEELIGSFTSKTRPVGRPRSLEHQQALRLDGSMGHLPIVGEPRRDCVV